MITFLKLGGSLITDKNVPHTSRPDVIRRLADEIYSAWEPQKSPLLIGHGSGSFGHVPAKKFGTRNGVSTLPQWQGFAEVHAEAAALNHIVTTILREAGLPILSFMPMNCIRSSNGKIISWDTNVLRECFERQLIPLIFGDTIFDDLLGGTIYSTEDLFVHLCSVFPEPPRILLAGLEEGVWNDFPEKRNFLHEIHASEPGDDRFILGSASTDVTGGMHEKVYLMKKLVMNHQAQSALIFSGEKPGNLLNALNGEKVGTSVLR